MPLRQPIRQLTIMDLGKYENNIPQGGAGGGRGKSIFFEVHLSFILAPCFAYFWTS
jgi:hypothetical protein